MPVPATSSPKEILFLSLGHTAYPCSSVEETLDCSQIDAMESSRAPSVGLEAHFEAEGNAEKKGRHVFGLRVRV